MTTSCPIQILAFGAHPDDIEFGCGGIIARETRLGRAAHFVVCSRGESGTNGTPRQRTAEAKKAAKLLGASLEFIQLDGDAHLELHSAHALRLARIIRRVRPAVVLAPTVEQNQHPDHWRLGLLARDATRLARFGGVKELKALAPHTVGRLFFYAVSPDAEPNGVQPVFIDVSGVLEVWTAAMRAHASQMKTRDYVNAQVVRATANGQRCGAAQAIALYPNDPLVLDSLSPFLKLPTKHTK
jgi:LmbE family N-acetylglucosaminyl deacetylase